MKKLALALLAGACLQPALALEAPTAQLQASGSNLSLSWTEVQGAESYLIYTKSEAYGAATLLAEVGAEVLSYDVTGNGAFFYVTVTGEEAGSTNLISNWDFETGDLTDWITTPSDDAEVTVTELNGPGAAGSYSASMSNEHLTYGLVLQQSTPVGSAGQGTVSWSFDMLLDQADAGGVFFFQVFAEQEGAGIVGGSGLQGPLWPWTEWQTFSGSFDAPAGTDFLTVQFSATTGGAEGSNCFAHIDNVVLEQGPIVVVPEAVPTVAAPTPTADADSVVALFSNAYTCVDVDTWSTDWDVADLVDTLIAGNDTKLYRNLSYAGIEFANPTVDASAMTRFHMDIWTPNAVTTAQFGIKLVDFGADGVYNGGDDTNAQIWINPASATPLQSETWVGIDVSMEAFGALASTEHLAQLIIEGLSTVYVDNVYFWNDGYVAQPDPTPLVAAPTPTVDADSVIALFSDAYTCVNVDSWSMSWDAADVTDTTVVGNATKLYTNMVYAGIEFANPTLDASEMTRFHMDIWLPEVIAGSQYGIKLVDWGADGAWSGGDDVEYMYWLSETTDPALSAENWLSLDLPLSAFTGLVTKGHLAQLIIQGQETVWVDNVYLWNDGSVVEGPAEPTVAAPTPSYDALNVISLFSNAYTNQTVDTWSAGWDMAAVSDVQIAGDDAKKYEGLTFAGIEFTSQMVDANSMSHFRMDIWTPDATDLPADFWIKLVDFGADGAYGGGDDVESELHFDASTTPALVSEGWVTFELPLSDFTSLVTHGHLAQLLIGGTPNTVYVDNVLFFSE